MVAMRVHGQVFLVAGFSRSLACELGDRVRVNTVCPGFIDSPMVSSLSPERLRQARECAILSRLGTPEV